MNVALYIRVSTEDQLEFSPDAQKKSLIEYAKKNNYQIDERYIFMDEGISGTSAKRRPAFMRMIATAKAKPKPFDAILVHKFDRFARSREDSVVYKSLLRKECGIKVISITEQLEDDKFSVILEAMLEAMAEYYSLNLADEVMKGMIEKAQRGGLQSRPVLGYDIMHNKRLINKQEADVVKKIYDMCINGESTSTIAKHLNRLGYRNKTGNNFDAKRIKYILENPVYMGVNRWNYSSTKGSKKVIKEQKDWVIVENTHEPIINKDIWNKAQESLSMWHKDIIIKNTGYVHWLGGILRCYKCGATLTYRTARFTRKDGSIRNADGYQCCKYKAGSCDTSNYLYVKNAEQHVLNILTETLTIVNDTGTFDGLNIECIHQHEDTMLYEMQLDKLKHKLDLAKKAYLNEIDTLAEYKENKIAIQKEMDELTNIINNNIIDDKIVSEFKTRLVTVISILEDPSIDINSKNKALKSILKSIIYNKSEETLVANFYI